MEFASNWGVLSCLSNSKSLRLPEPLTLESSLPSAGCDAAAIAPLSPLWVPTSSAHRRILLGSGLVSVSCKLGMQNVVIDSYARASRFNPSSDARYHCMSPHFRTKLRASKNPSVNFTTARNVLINPATPLQCSLYPKASASRL